MLRECDIGYSGKPSLLVTWEGWATEKPLLPPGYDSDLYVPRLYREIARVVDGNVIRLSKVIVRAPTSVARPCNFVNACGDHVRVSWRSLLRRRR